MPRAAAAAPALSPLALGGRNRTLAGPAVASLKVLATGWKDPLVRSPAAYPHVGQAGLGAGPSAGVADSAAAKPLPAAVPARGAA